MRQPRTTILALAALLAASLGLGQGEFAPIPNGVWGPQIDFEKGYFVEEIDGGLYWVTDGSYQMIFLTTGEGVIAVDAPPSIGQNILNAIAEVTDETVTHVVYSHSHADHIAGAGLFPEGAVVIAHEDTASQLEAAHSNDRAIPFDTFVGGGPVPLPTVTFSDSYTLTVGSQTLQLDYKGNNHEPGNSFVYAPAQKVLMLVDVVFPGWIPFTELALAEDVPGYFRAHDQVLEYDFESFVGGHLTRLGTRQDVETQQAYLRDIQANAIAALQTVDFFAIANEIGFENQWALFDAYLGRRGPRPAPTPPSPTGSGSLGAVDVWDLHALLHGDGEHSN